MSFGEEIVKSIKEAMEDGITKGLIVTVPTTRQAAFAAIYLCTSGIPATFITK
jgi:hypothetical protein